MRKFIMKMDKHITLLFLLILFLLPAFSQSGTIKGKITDSASHPLIGATVRLRPSNLGTVSDANGNYILNNVSPGTYSLIISYLGQSVQKQDITVSAGATLEQDFTLSASSELAEVQVGSRSRLPRTVISTPVPVDILTMKEVKAFPQADISQMLTYAAPSFQSSHQSITDGTDHIDPASLRGLGPDQTLVLVNGKRRHTTALVNINGSVGRGSVGTDLNAIPAAAVERIEILRDGAAAQYGSDAIAGVINVVLKKKFKGFSASGSLGENFTNMPYNGGTKINDGFTRQVDFSAGTYTGNGAYVNLSGQWLQRDQSNRSGNDNGPLMYIGNTAGGFPTPPASAVPPGVTTAQYRDWLLDQDAAIIKQRRYDRHNMIVGQASANNFSGFLNAGSPLTRNIDFYATVGAAHRTGQSEGNARTPSSISQQPQTTGGMPYYTDGFLPQIHTRIEDRSVLAGFKGKLGSWNADLSNTYGQNNMYFMVKNSGNASSAPSDNPQTSFDAGAQKFSQNTVNLDLDRKWDLGTKSTLNLSFGGEYRYETFALIEGEPNSWNTGPNPSISATVPAYPGGSSYNISATPAPGAQVFPGLQPSNALYKNRNIYAGYVDAEYTLGKLLLGAAGRYESYNETSAHLTYNGTGTKFTARYEITPDIAVRGSLGTGFRAPSLHQRYYNSTSTQFINGLPSNTLTANNESSIVRNAFGINELKPETSSDYTAGIVSRFGRSLTLSVDGYFIHIDNRIVLSAAFQRSNPLVAAIFNAYNVPASTSVVQFWTNAINTDTKGLDIVINKRYKLGKGSGNISLAANFNQNTVVGPIHTNSAIDAASNNPSQTDPSKNPTNDLRNILFDRLQRTRIEKGAPTSKINLTLTYNCSKWDFLARAVRFGEVTQLSTSNPAAINPTNGFYWDDQGLGADQTFSAKIITDLVISYKINHAIGVTIGANNLFDVYPERIFIDPRNDPAAVYANPVASTVTNSKAAGGYSSARDQSNRGRFLFTPNQFAFNGRYLFARVNVQIF